MKPEEIKEKIYNFLKENKGERYSLIEIVRKTRISYPSVMKYIPMLVLESQTGKRKPPVKLQDHGHIKLVWIEK